MVTRTPNFSHDPRAIFNTANRFLKAAEALINRPGDVELGQPIIVLSAFASELFMKCIIEIETGRAPRGHDLKNLYSKIGRKSRTRITELWDTHVVPKRSPFLDAVEKIKGITIKRDLQATLAQGAQTFADVRYGYEKQPTGNFFLQDLPSLLRVVVFELKPEWK